MSAPTNATVLKMNDADTIKFLELYQNEPVLWDPTMEQYKKRDSRAAATKRIASVLNIKGFTDAHVILKFKNLRSSYSQELKNIANSKKSGTSPDDVYVPKVAWFKTMDSFLKPHVKSRATQSNLEVPEDGDSADTQGDLLESQEDDQSEQLEANSTQPSISHQANSTQPSTSHQANSTQPSISHQANSTQPSKSHQANSTQPLTPLQSVGYQITRPPIAGKRANVETPKHSQHKRTKHCKNPDNIVATENDINSALGKLERISERAANLANNSREDSYDCFGKYIASLLRSLPSQRAFELQAEITSLILNSHINSSVETRPSTSSSYYSSGVQAETPQNVLSPYSIDETQEDWITGLSSAMQNYS